jgi:hypothetical protein
MDTGSKDVVEGFDGKLLKVANASVNPIRSSCFFADLTMSYSVAVKPKTENVVDAAPWLFIQASCKKKIAFRWKV